jgi:SIR2-like domain
MSEREPPDLKVNASDGVLGEKRLRERIALKNRDTLASLVRQLRSPLGAIPFVGAGMSASVKVAGDPPWFPQWGELLTRLAAMRPIEGEVAALLAKGDFEEAASAVDKDRPGVLAQSVRDAFDKEVLSEYLTTGALSYLPLLARGPVITTNYDRVLEQVFDAVGRSFKDWIPGPRPDELVAAIHADRHALVKMHGDCRDRTDQVLTAESYKAAYGDALATGDHEGRIGGLAWLLFTNRPLLFLGCSLERDRTVDVLRAIRRRLPGVWHYAILAAEETSDRWNERERELDAMGVRPLWYYPRRFEGLEFLLREALEGSSSTPLTAGAGQQSVRKASHSPVPMAAVRPQLHDQFSDSGRSRHQAELRVICDALVSGKLAFFLGAYAGLDQSLLGSEFYNQLAAEFDCPDGLAGDRTAVAAYVTNRYGSDSLWQFISKNFRRRLATPSVLHRFIAALPGLLREHGVVASLCVMTTNYETLIEQALTDNGEEFQLLYYADTNYRREGCFLERSAGGVVRQIDKAENMRFRDTSTHLVVKLNGGMSYFGDIKEQALVERAQFERLAQRIPDVLPAYLRAELNSRSMLFLGHGLQEPDVGAIIREFAGSTKGGPGSWAVQLAPNNPRYRPAWDARAKDLHKLGVTLLDDDLQRFVASLDDRLEATLTA